ncbi:MAG TPA: hypothetical protein VGR35_05565 [Tepidisphaeraceae bacterium]|nr:hypothetical protein [Tepidisphaeraceae bacterium]
MRRSRHVLAAVVVATALCADRVATAAPQARPQVANLARTVASKLSASFQRVVPTIRFVEDRRVVGCVTSTLASAEAASPALSHASDASPFRFRLPPPTL